MMNAPRPSPLSYTLIRTILPKWGIVVRKLSTKNPAASKAGCGSQRFTEEQGVTGIRSAGSYYGHGSSYRHPFFLDAMRLHSWLSPCICLGGAFFGVFALLFRRLLGHNILELRP